MIRLSIDGRILALLLSPACILFACFAPCSYTCAGRRTRAQGWWWRFEGLDMAELQCPKVSSYSLFLHLPLCHCESSVLVLLCVWVCYIYFTQYLVGFSFRVQHHAIEHQPIFRTQPWCYGNGHVLNENPNLNIFVNSFNVIWLLFKYIHITQHVFQLFAFQLGPHVIVLSVCILIKPLLYIVCTHQILSYYLPSFCFFYR